jgi:PilZ domain
MWAWMLPMKVFNPEFSAPATDPTQSSPSQEVRCAVRFPLALPVMLSTGNGDVAALSRNVSASGVLFELDRELSTGQDIHFSLRMPGPVLGTIHDVLVHCLGRVVRCSLSQTQYLAAATIDEYQFSEQ